MRLDLIFEDLGDFVQAYKGRISVDGVVMEATTAQAEGTVLELTISLADQMVLINGKAGVLRTQERATLAGTLSTMVLRFIELDEDSRSLIERMEDRHQSEGIAPFSLDQALSKWPEPAVPSVSGGRPVPALAEDSPLGAVPAASAPAGPSVPPEMPADGAPSSSPAEVYDMVSTALDGDVGLDSPAGSGVSADPIDGPRSSAGLRPVVLLAALAIAAVVIAVVVIFFPNLVGLGSGPEPPPVSTPVTIEATPTVAAAEQTPITLADDTPVAATPTPAPPPPTAPPTVGPSDGMAIVNISWSAEADTTVVVITADAAIDPASFKHFRLSDAPGPREVLQISGIHRSELRYTTPVDGPRLRKIRAWHHDDRTPPELQVVFDLTGPGVTLESVASDGVRMVLRFEDSSTP